MGFIDNNSNNAFLLNVLCVRVLAPPCGLSLHLLSVLLLLLLELPEVGLDGAGGLLHLNGAERRNGRGACPVAGVGFWAGQETGDSQRGNSRGGNVCSNDWGSNTNQTLKPPVKSAFFLVCSDQFQGWMTENIICGSHGWAYLRLR